MEYPTTFAYSASLIILGGLASAWAQEPIRVDPLNEVRTVGDLLRLLIEALEKDATSLPIDQDAVFTKLRDIIIDQLRVQPDLVTMSARFVDDLHAD
ncbi:MAG: hypothetical protein AAES65_06070 [Candidatus Thiodiazotropha sp. (ex. Lucinoma kazani)]